jgi:hypothetical protein
MRKTSFVPPIEVSHAAKMGLAFRKKFGRGGTAVGLARGRQLASRRPVSEDIIKRMYSYFCRHFVDKQGKNYGSEVKPSNGYIAWLLWGGDAGASWAEKIRNDMKKGVL